ncbi:MAG TPA: hypothetical protein VFM59_07660, partial [Salinimicrobium sp.]|nr:hypothetical protein [Salinimicrobium sp.]
SGKISGFIIHPDSTYIIDPNENEIEYQNKILDLAPEDIIKNLTGIYLRSDLFGKIFGLNPFFDFRSLSIQLQTDLELPMIKKMRLEQRRSRISEARGIIIPDTLIERKYPFFRAGMLDWGITTTQQTTGRNINRFNLGVGTMIAGGETNIQLNYSSRVPFSSRNQFYQWRYVNNDNPVLSQVTAGKIFSRATSTLYAPVVGIQLSNSPVKNRRSFGTYSLSDFTEPRWTVELYVNNVLMDYTQADASGFYTFEVPLMYGNTTVNLRFYGPWGEERTEERVINIPYTFIPENELEYTFSAGIVENEENNRFSRFDLNYGLSKKMTIGAGVEYLSDVESGEIMPFLSTSMSLASNLLLSGEYTFGVKAEALLSYRTASNFQIDLNYINYDPEQTAINYNYLEERKIIMSLPIRSRLFSAYSRFSLNQIILPSTQFTTAQFLLSGVVMGISTNFTTYGLFNDRNRNPTIYSTLSQTYRLPYRLMFSPQVQYDFGSSELTNINLELERPVFERGFMNLAYERNFLREAHTVEIGLRYIFDFANTSAISRLGNRNSSFVQSARGSLLFDDQTGYVRANNRSSIGKGALTIIPFLDLNSNGKKEENEAPVPGLRINNMGGRISYNKEKTMIRIYDLEPYVPFILELNPVSLDNIAWKINNPKIAVEMVPNQFRTIYIPVNVLGEVAGSVYFKDQDGIRGQGRIIVNILNENGEKAGKVLSEGDGYFSFLGLAPGKYTAEIDPAQLKDIGYSASPQQIPFEIEISEYGDIVDALEFTLEKL